MTYCWLVQAQASSEAKEQRGTRDFVGHQAALQALPLHQLLLAFRIEPEIKAAAAS